MVQKGAQIVIPKMHPMVRYHKDSIQFNLVGYSFDQVRAILPHSICSIHIVIPRFCYL